MTVRVCKAILVLVLALCAGLLTFNALATPEPVQAFFRGMMQMEASAPDAVDRWRAVADERFWMAGYWTYVAGQGLTCALLLIGSLRLFLKRRALVDEFQAAKALTVMGAMVGVLTWFGGVVVLGGAWFLVPVSEILDALPVAALLCPFLLLVAGVVLQTDTELEANKKPRRRPLG